MIEAILFITILILSVALHEASHGYAAYYLGDDTAQRMGRLTLNPIKHLDPVGSVIVPALMYFTTGFVFGWAKPVPFNPYALRDSRWDPSKVALAGPASNLALVVVFAILFRLVPLGPFAIIVMVNLVLALFNLIPIPPLDGSKVLFAIIPDRWASIRLGLDRYGFFLLILFVFVGWRLASPLVLWLINLALFA